MTKVTVRVNITFFVFFRDTLKVIIMSDTPEDEEKAAFLRFLSIIYQVFLVIEYLIVNLISGNVLR